MINKILKQLVTVSAMVLLPILLVGQDSNLGNWLIYIGSKKVNDRWNIHNEVQYRNYNAIGDLEQLLLRTGVGYNLTPGNNNFLLGYGFIRSENYVNADDKVVVNEHRIFQQFVTKHKISKLKVQHRYRFEQRFVEDDFRMRFRYFLAANYPLTMPSEEKTQEWYLSAYNEVFLNSEVSVFDRNRLYGGVGCRVNKNLRLELGYMNQFFPGEGNGRDQINLIGFVNF